MKGSLSFARIRVHSCLFMALPRFRFSSMLARVVLLAALAVTAPLSAAAAIDPALETALKSFRTEGPPGWSFTQTTEAAGESRVEYHDATRPAFSRWSLVQVDGRTPTTDEIQDYNEKASRRSRAGTAPRLESQIDFDTLSIADETPERITYRARLKEAEDGDATARYLVATIVLHRPSTTIESFQIASTESFSPVLGVKIAEMKTVMFYSLPDEDRPSLLLKSETRLRGRAFFLKSLDADMTVTFTDYKKAFAR